MENKQTAVEWLVEELTKQNMFMHLFSKEIEQAKAMEKEQIENACDRFANSIDFTIEDFELYYNETYGK
jgi:hypothetical protein